MKNEKIHIFAEGGEDSMFPLPGESDTDYKIRIYKLREERRANMSEAEKLQLAVMRSGKPLPELKEGEEYDEDTYMSLLKDILKKENYEEIQV